MDAQDELREYCRIDRGEPSRCDHCHREINDRMVMRGVRWIDGYMEAAEVLCPECDV